MLFLDSFFYFFITKYEYLNKTFYFLLFRDTINNLKILILKDEVMLFMKKLSLYFFFGILYFSNR